MRNTIIGKVMQKVDRVALNAGFRIADRQLDYAGYALSRRYVKDDYVYVVKLKQSDIEIAYEDEVRFKEIVDKKIRGMVI